MTWFFNASPGAQPSARIFCFPYAGGSAAAFRPWGSLLGTSVETLGVQLPGRSWRLSEPPVANLSDLADQTAEAIAPLSDLPFVIFGHSMGAWLGFEVARRLEDRGEGPALVCVSGRQAPSRGALQSPIGPLSDDAFIAEMQLRYNAIPSQILDNPDVLELVLPALRADISALENHTYRPGTPLRCPIAGFLGSEDPVVAAADMELWREETRADFGLELFPGGHFFFSDDPAPLTRAIERALMNLAVS